MSLLGFLIYFAYGIWNSSEGKKTEPIFQGKKPIYLAEDDGEHQGPTP